MIFEIASFSLTAFELCLIVVSAALVGMAKTGVQGVGIIAVPLLVLVFGGKASTGVMLPILIFADLIGVYYYHQHANWRHLKRLIPFALVGIVTGTAIGELINDLIFRQSMVATIFLCLAIMIWREKNGQAQIPTSTWFVATIGIIGGFTTMVGNLAGPVMALYLLSMRLPKNQFIGTAAWFFLLVNVLKVPFHVMFWGTITMNSLILNFTLLPAIIIGGLLGVTITQRIPENAFRWFVIVMAAISALAMLV